MRVLVCLVAILALLVTAPPAAASGFTPDDSVWALQEAASDIGVSYRVLKTVALCETGDTLDPYSRGDRGHSHGLFQLNDTENGLLNHYHAVTGGASAYNPYASAKYFARVLRGDYADDGITAYRWTCFRIWYG